MKIKFLSKKHGSYWKSRYFTRWIPPDYVRISYTYISYSGHSFSGIQIFVTSINTVFLKKDINKMCNEYHLMVFVWLKEPKYLKYQYLLHQGGGPDGPCLPCGSG